jgi:5-formyltetrahydrofolate cyclo-ligase
VKDQIRKETLQQRDSLSLEDKIIKSTAIMLNLFQLPEFKSARSVIIYNYNSIGSEVRTEHLIRDMGEFKTVIVPIVVDGCIKLSELINYNAQIPGRFGIKEPAIKRLKALEDADIAIIPGTAFDIHGNRIGHGCGYFDRFLRGSGIVKVGLAYELQVKKAVPYRPKMDVKMDIIITECRIIRVGMNNVLTYY